jgi:ribosomal protein S20
MIEQRAFLRGHQKFEIRRDGELEVTVKRFNSHNQFKFPLWHLNPSPTRRKIIPPGPIVGAVIFGLICAGFVVAMLVGLFTTRDWGLLGALAFPLFLFGIIFVACISKLLTMSINANVFHFRNGQGQLHIWFGKPDKETFNAFCETLSKKAEEAWNNRPIEPAAQSLAGELAALKKLKDSGVLSDAEFERAKAKLLEQVEQKRIGFA